MKLTMAQAVVRYLNNQYVERDNKENKFIAGRGEYLDMGMSLVLERHSNKIKN